MSVTPVTVGAVALLIGGILSVSHAAGSEPVLIPTGQKQLFLDDFVVDNMQGLQRTMHQPTKRGPVLKPDIRSDGTMVQTRTAPMWDTDEGVYKIIYLAYTMDNTSKVGPALAVSKDGITWTKPNLGQMELYGSKDNNRIVVDPASNTWGYNCIESAVYDPDDPDPSRRYKAFLGAVGREPIVSPDCIHWRKIGASKIPSGDEGTLTYDRGKRRFLAALKGGNRYGRAFNISTSKDFENWTKPRFLFGADAEDQPLAVKIIRERLADPGMPKPLFIEPDPATGWKPPKGKRHIPTWRAECYCFGLFPYEGLYIGWAMMYYPTGTDLPQRTNTDGFDLIKLAMSRDLVHWRRLGNRRPFIGPSRIDKGRVGVWDRGQLAITNRPVERDDELWFYYSGMKWRDNIYKKNLDGSPRDISTLTDEERADLKEGWGAICLAVLRRDGFVSLDAGKKRGTVLTKPLKLTGSRLMLNLDAGKSGSAIVEILGRSGRAVRGFSRRSAVAVTGDAVRLPVKWKSGGDISRLDGKVVRLKIHLRNASLFAFWTEAK